MPIFYCTVTIDGNRTTSELLEMVICCYCIHLSGYAFSSALYLFKVEDKKTWINSLAGSFS